MNQIDESDLGVDYQDSGPWRSYGLESSGKNIEELFENAWIYETDQDGGELDYYMLEEASNEVITAAKKYISSKIEEDVYNILLKEDYGDE